MVFELLGPVVKLLGGWACRHDGLAAAMLMLERHRISSCVIELLELTSPAVRTRDLGSRGRQGLRLGKHRVDVRCNRIELIVSGWWHR